MRADLQSKQSQLQVQIAVVKSQYMALTPKQREAWRPFRLPRHRRGGATCAEDPATWPPRPAASHRATSPRRR